jgi:hypothetical protein
MRSISVVVIALATTCFAGCSWSDFWGGVFDSVNGDEYHTDYSTNGAFDFRDRYEQQARLAEEYRHE